MKRLRLLAAITFSIVTLSLMWAVPVSAHSFHSGNTVDIGQDQPINDTLFAAGSTVTINSEVFGDVFCAGQTVTITGTVHGDVICAAQTIHLTGTVDGDVRLAGQTVTVGAAVSGNATIAGQTFILDASGKIGGDISLAATDMSLNGPVGRDIAASGRSLTIADTVGRNVTGTLETLHLTSSARVAGGIDYMSAQPLTRDNGAAVGGQINRTQPPERHANGVAILGIGLIWFLYWLLALLFTSMILVLLFPRLFYAVTGRAWPWPWKALLTGFLASLAVPVLFLVLAVTIIGIPLALLLLLAWLIIVFLSGPVAAFYIGRLILRRSRHALLVMLVGAIVLMIGYAIPLLDILIFVLATWIGEGALLLEIFHRTPRPRYTVEAPTEPKRLSAEP